MAEDNKNINENLDIDENDALISEEDFEEIVTVVDEETGESFDFYVACNFDFNEELYYVLVSLDDNDPVALFAKKVSLENGEIGFETVDEENFPMIAEEYERLCNELDEEDDYDFDYEHEHDHDHDHDDDCPCCHH